MSRTPRAGSRTLLLVVAAGWTALTLGVGIGMHHLPARPAVIALGTVGAVAAAGAWRRRTSTAAVMLLVSALAPVGSPGLSMAVAGVALLSLLAQARLPLPAR